MNSFRTYVTPPAVFATMFFLAASGVFVFEISTIRDIYAKAETRATELDQILREQDNIRQIQSDLIATRATREALSSYITTDRTAARFIEEIETHARDAGLSVSISSLNIVEGPPATLQVSIRGEGSWQEAMYFLSILEKLPRNISIENVVMAKIGSNDEGREERWRASYDIVLKSFRITE